MMNKEFSTVLIEANFNFKNKIDLNNTDTTNKIISKIKDKYKFEEFEVKNDCIIFLKGFPNLICLIKNDKVRIVTANLNNTEPTKNIINIIKDIKESLGTEYLCVSEYQIINVLEFKEDSSIFKMLPYCNANKLGKITNISINLDTFDKNKEFKIAFYTRNNINYVSAMLNTSINFKSDEQLTQVLENNKKDMLIKLNNFLGECK